MKTKKGLIIYSGLKGNRFTYFVRAEEDKNTVPVNEENISSYLYKKFSEIRKKKPSKKK